MTPTALYFWRIWWHGVAIFTVLMIVNGLAFGNDESILWICTITIAIGYADALRWYRQQSRRDAIAPGPVVSFALVGIGFFVTVGLHGPHGAPIQHYALTAVAVAVLSFPAIWLLLLALRQFARMLS
jgi:hypothetical protein